MNDDKRQRGSAGDVPLRKLTDQIIPDTFILFEYTLDPNLGPTTVWNTFTDVFSGKSTEPDEIWQVDQLAIADLATATAIRLTQLTTASRVSNVLVEETPRQADWTPSTTNPTPFPSGDTFIGLYTYNSEGQSGDLSITFALAPSREGTKIDSTTWYSPVAGLIGLDKEPNQQLILTRAGTSYPGSPQMSTSSYKVVI